MMGTVESATVVLPGAAQWPLVVGKTSRRSTRRRGAGGLSRWSDPGAQAGSLSPREACLELMLIMAWRGAGEPASAAMMSIT